MDLNRTSKRSYIMLKLVSFKGFKDGSIHVIQNINRIEENITQPYK
jgi:hypothetical protein